VVGFTAGEVARVAASYAGHYLRPLLGRRGGAGSRGKRPAATEAAE